MIRRITCTSAGHASRRGLDDGRLWSNNLGMYTGAEHPPVVCNRCAFYDGITNDPMVAGFHAAAIVQGLLDAVKAAVE